MHDGYWSVDEMRDLMAACDAYVSLHRSEGTGLTITDAMALGKPVIATGWSGNTDFMNVSNSFPVSHELVEIQKSVGPYQAGQTWAEPSVEHAAQCMRAAYDDRDAAQARGRAAQRDIETHYSEQAIGQRINERLETIGIRQRWPPGMCTDQALASNGEERDDRQSCCKAVARNHLVRWQGTSTCSYPAIRDR